MSVLVDTNLLLRIAEPHHPQSAIVAASVGLLLGQGKALHLIPQIAYEFWVVATRPLAQNGLQMPTPHAKAKLDELMKPLVFLADTADIFPEWQRLVVTFDCKGKPAHDARIVAAMNVHGVRELLTFNVKDFTRYPDIRVLDPAQVVATRP